MIHGQATAPTPGISGGQRRECQAVCRAGGIQPYPLFGWTPPPLFFAKTHPTYQSISITCLLYGVKFSIHDSLLFVAMAEPIKGRKLESQTAPWVVDFYPSISLTSVTTELLKTRRRTMPRFHRGLSSLACLASRKVCCNYFSTDPVVLLTLKLIL